MSTMSFFLTDHVTYPNSNNIPALTAMSHHKLLDFAQERVARSTSLKPKVHAKVTGMAYRHTLQATNISHLGEKENNLQKCHYKRELC